MLSCNLQFLDDDSGHRDDQKTDTLGRKPLQEVTMQGRQKQTENQKVSRLNHTLNEQPPEGQLKPTFYEIIISQSISFQIWLYNMALISCLRILTNKEVICRTELYYIPAMTLTAEALKAKHIPKNLQIQKNFFLYSFPFTKSDSQMVCI